MRGRTVPPRQQAPTVAQMAARIAGQPGLFMLEYRHEDTCPTITSQRTEDCTCGDMVDHRLLRYQPEAGAR